MSVMRFAVLVAVLVSAFGCHGQKIEVNGIQVYERIWNRTVAELESRASYEMQCSPAQLQFLLMYKEGRYPTQVAVMGCEKRAMYVRTIIKSLKGQWTLSSASWLEQPAPTPAPPPPAAAQPEPAQPAPAQATGVSI